MWSDSALSLKFCHGYSALSADVHGGFRKQWAQDGATWIPCPPSPFSFAICSSNFSQVSQRSLLLIICVVSLASWKVGVHEQDSTRHPIHCFSYSVSPYNSFCLRPKYKYGFEVPQDYRHAMQLHKQNGNTKWQEAVDTEYELVVIEYEAFIDKG